MGGVFCFVVDRQRNPADNSKMLSKEVQALIDETHRWSASDRYRKRAHEEELIALNAGQLEKLLSRQMDGIRDLAFLWDRHRTDFKKLKEELDKLPYGDETPHTFIYQLISLYCAHSIDMVETHEKLDLARFTVSDQKRLVDDAKEAIEFRDRVMELRMDSAESVEILCDNEDGPNAVVVSAEWTNWVERRYEGVTVLECLQNACKDKRKVWFHEACKLARSIGMRALMSNLFDEHLESYLAGNTPRQEINDQISAAQ